MEETTEVAGQKTNMTEKKKREKSSAIRHVSLSPIVVVVVVANWLLLLLPPPTFICSSETGTDLEAAEAPLEVRVHVESAVCERVLLKLSDHLAKKKYTHRTESFSPAMAAEL